MRIDLVSEIPSLAFEKTWLFANVTDEVIAENRSWLDHRYIEPETGRFILSHHSYLVRTPRWTAIVDTCCGNHKPRPRVPAWDNLNRPYLDNMQALGVAPEEVDFVMCTHLHVDHVGWNTRLENGKWVPTFPNAKYVMSRTDHDHWAALAKKPDTEAYQVNTYNDSVLPIVEARKAEFVAGEHAMCGCLTLKPAPGHTPGQIRLDLDSRGKRAIFAGDALHNPVQVPLWKWNSRFCEDRNLAARSRNTLLGDCVEQGALLMPAHFAPPHAAYVKAKGDRFELDWDYDNSRGH